LKKIENLSLCMSIFLVIASTTGDLFLTSPDTFVQAQQSPQHSINARITVPLDPADSIYNSSKTTFYQQRIYH
jgi:hypothetical protein